MKRLQELVTGTIKCQMKTSRSKICCLHNLVFSNVNFGTAVLKLGYADLMHNFLIQSAKLTWTLFDSAKYRILLMSGSGITNEMLRLNEPLNCHPRHVIFPAKNFEGKWNAFISNFNLWKLFRGKNITI